MADEFADVIRLYLTENKAAGAALVKDGQHFYSKVDNKLYLKENDSNIYELPEQTEITSQITTALAAKTDLVFDANNYIEIQSNRFDVYVAGDLVYTAQASAGQVRMYNFLLDSFIGLDNTEAQINAGGTAWVKASKTTGLVTNSNEASDYAGANDDLTITKGILEAEAGSLTGLVTQWRNGYDGAQDPEYKYNISLSWDSINRRVTVSNSVTGTVKFWTNDTFYELTNGDTKLYTDLPDENNSFFLYFDASGQLSWVRDSAVTNEALLYCIVAKMVYDSDVGDEILAIKEQHDAFEPIGLRGRLHNTDGTVWSSGAVLSLATVGSDAVSITAGVAYDEDVKINMAAQTQTGAVFPKYYFDGKNASALDRIKRGSVSNKIALFDTEISLGVTGRPVYNLNTAGTWSPQILGTNDYMCMHMFGANGADFVADIDYTIAVGQASYNSVADARAGVEAEASSLQIGASAIREAVLLYSFIIDDTGSIVAVDGAGNTFIDWRSQKAGSSGGSAVLQDLASVLNVGNSAGNQKLINVQGGNASGEVITYDQLTIESVLANNSDANGESIGNLESLAVGTPVFSSNITGGKGIHNKVVGDFHATYILERTGGTTHVNRKWETAMAENGSYLIYDATGAAVALNIDINAVVSAPNMTTSEIKDESTGKVLTTREYVQQGGATGSRPSSPSTHQPYFDTTIGKPIWYNGTNWVDATGTTV